MLALHGLTARAPRVLARRARCVHRNLQSAPQAQHCVLRGGGRRTLQVATRVRVERCVSIATLLLSLLWLCLCILFLLLVSLHCCLLHARAAPTLVEPSDAAAPSSETNSQLTATQHNTTTCKCSNNTNMSICTLNFAKLAQQPQTKPTQQQTKTRETHENTQQTKTK